MKSVIIIAVMLLIPVTVFAQIESDPICSTGYELVNGICQKVSTPTIDDFREIRDSIREYRQNNEFEKALELIEQTDFPKGSWHNAILYEKYIVLAKMSKHQEALDVQREWIQNRSEVVEFDGISYHEAILLYHLGKYSEALKIINSSIDGINDFQDGDKQAGLVITYFWKGMISEKMGKYEQGEQAYSSMSSLTFPSERDCVKVKTLTDFGGYVEAMQILNNMDEKALCNEDTVEYLKSLVQKMINKYQPNSSAAEYSGICGVGSIENKDGICVPNPNYNTSSNGGGCLIATATYDTELAPQVQQLRELRDNQLLNTKSGTSFMKHFNDFYYSFSPIIADYERENPLFKEMIKIAITPMITSLSVLNYVDIDSEESVLGYGISLIIFNGLMYVGIPIIAIIGIKKKF